MVPNPLELPSLSCQMEDKYVGTEVCGSTLLLVMGIMGYTFFIILLYYSIKDVGKQSSDLQMAFIVSVWEVVEASGDQGKL